MKGLQYIWLCLVLHLGVLSGTAQAQGQDPCDLIRNEYFKVEEMYNSGHFRELIELAPCVNQIAGEIKSK
ncbi:MAG: hypothetical protein AAF570_23580, partial [Bacteroidota bacterium]